MHKTDKSSLRVKSEKSWVFWYLGIVFFPYVPSYKTKSFLFTNKATIQNSDIMHTQFAFEKKSFS